MPPTIRMIRTIRRGFTLIELVVVIAILGIMVAVASLSIGNRNLEDQLDLESQRVEQLLRLALEEAEFKGQNLGVRFGKQGYVFLVGQGEKWQVFEGSPFRQRALPAPFVLELRVEGQPVVLPEQPLPGKDDKDDKTPLTPQALLLSSGEATALELRLLVAPQPTLFYQITVDALGQIKRERAQDA